MHDTDVVFMGQPPLRVEFLRTVSEVSTEQLFAQAVAAELDGARLKVASIDDPITNKRACGRRSDL